MKKIPAIFLLFLSLILILCGCTTTEDAEQKFIAVACRNEHIADGIVTSSDYYTCTCNDAGLTTYSEYYEDDLLLSQSSYEYDEFGNLVKVITESNGTVETSEFKYTMDEKGHVLRQEMYQNGELCFIDEFTYDKKGNELTHELTAFSENEESDYRKYTKTYNRKGELIQETLHWNFNGQYIVWDYENELCMRQTTYAENTDKIAEYFVNTYDEKGNLVRESKYDAADNLKDYTEYTWDETGLVQTITFYSADGILEDYYVRTYDEYGNHIMTERYINGEVAWITYYVYERL